MSHPNLADLQWLHEIQRSDESSSPAQRIQGSLVDSILIGQDAVDSTDYYAVIQATIDFVNWALQNAYLVHGEYPQEALWAYYTDYYRTQVSNGGHDQFVANSRFTLVTVGACLRGLEAIGAQEHLAIFQDLVKLVDQLGDNDAPRDYFKALDDRYFSMDSTDIITNKLDVWLRALPCLEAQPHDVVLTSLNRVKRRNPLMETRAREHQKRRQAYEESSATYRVIKALCQAAGRRFYRLTAGAVLPMRRISPSAADRREFCWGVHTDGGILNVFFLQDKGFLGAKHRAEMWLMNAATPAATTKLTREDYEEIIPEWLRTS